MLTYIQIYKESLPFSLNMQSLVILILFFLFYVWATCLHWVAVGGFFPPNPKLYNKNPSGMCSVSSNWLGHHSSLVSSVSVHSYETFKTKFLCVSTHGAETLKALLLTVCVCVNESVEQSRFICLYPWYWNMLVQSLCIYTFKLKNRINLIIPRKERAYTAFIGFNVVMF